MKFFSILTLCVLIAGCFASVADAGTFADGVCSATKPALIGGLAVAYFNSKDHGLRDAARTGEAMLISGAVAQAIQLNFSAHGASDLKHTFPSKRTAVAFAAATSLADVYPKQKWIAYAGAALIGWSTVAVNGHTWSDVAAGAALGFGAGRWTTSSRNGILLGRVFKF